MTIPRTNELVETPFLTLESALEVKKIAKILYTKQHSPF